MIDDYNCRNYTVGFEEKSAKNIFIDKLLLICIGVQSRKNISKDPFHCSNFLLHTHFAKLSAPSYPATVEFDDDEFATTTKINRSPRKIQLFKREHRIALLSPCFLFLFLSEDFSKMLCKAL